GVQIVNGAVSNPASGEAQVRGRVSPKGAVTVTVQAGGQWARGSGRLDLGRGGGVWRGQGTAGRGAARLASRHEGLADQFTIMHPAIGPHHGAHIKSPAAA